MLQDEKRVTCRLVCWQGLEQRHYHQAQGEVSNISTPDPHACVDGASVGVMLDTIQARDWSLSWECRVMRHAGLGSRPARRGQPTRSPRPKLHQVHVQHDVRRVSPSVVSIGCLAMLLRMLKQNGTVSTHNTDWSLPPVSLSLSSFGFLPLHFSLFDMSAFAALRLPTKSQCKAAQHSFSTCRVQ